MHKKKFQPNIPTGITRVLLHSCCAPCSTAIVEYLMDHHIEPTILYYNPNTYPKEEYELRKTEIMKLAQSFHITFVEGKYDHDNWLRNTRDLQHEQEGGKRCLICFTIRLAETARYAHENGFNMFTTTLASSRWKNIEQVTEAGLYAAGLFPEMTYWEQNWRKYGLTERKHVLNKNYNFYHQEYCGCEFSLRDSNKWRKAHGKPMIKLYYPE